VTDRRTFATTIAAFGTLCLVHALVTWPLAATVALFFGGATVAVLAEVVVVELGWLDHHVGPQLAGVPLYVLFGWTGAVYAAFRGALLVTDGWLAVAAGAALATGWDLLTDHRGVANGYWTYTDDLPGPRFRGVPWWNFAGWLVVSATTAGLAVPFLS
jgi:uncharacterized membrane protein